MAIVKVLVRRNLQFTFETTLTENLKEGDSVKEIELIMIMKTAAATEITITKS